MAEVISDAAYSHSIGLCDIDVKNLAGALTAHGFGDAREAGAKALEEAAEWETELLGNPVFGPVQRDRLRARAAAVRGEG